MLLANWKHIFVLYALNFCGHDTVKLYCYTQGYCKNGEAPTMPVQDCIDLLHVLTHTSNRMILLSWLLLISFTAAQFEQLFNSVLSIPKTIVSAFIDLSALWHVKQNTLWRWIRYYWVHPSHTLIFFCPMLCLGSCLWPQTLLRK